jgi:solute carrier family 6 serotonin transporter-like protein 4
VVGSPILRDLTFDATAGPIASAGQLFQGGVYLVNLLNVYGPGIAILFVVFVEAAGVCWFYGVDRFSHDIEKMIGHRPGIFWRVCWNYISPVFLLVSHVYRLEFLTLRMFWERFLSTALSLLTLDVCYRRRYMFSLLQVIFIFSLLGYEEMLQGEYTYPAWTIMVGWMLTASSLICIPLYIVYKLIITPGNIMQVHTLQSDVKGTYPLYRYISNITFSPRQLQRVPGNAVGSAT